MNLFDVRLSVLRTVIFCTLGMVFSVFISELAVAQSCGVQQSVNCTTADCIVQAEATFPAGGATLQGKVGWCPTLTPTATPTVTPTSTNTPTRTPTPVPLTVTYDSQGGSVISSGTTTVGGQIASSPGTPRRVVNGIDYSFKGWFTAASGGTAITFPYTHGRTSNFTLYGQWATLGTPTLVQNIATNGAFKWESFVINGETYLAVNAYSNNSTGLLNSNIYKWNGTSFILVQSIATNRAWAPKSFVINGVTYLAMAENLMGEPNNPNSEIYSWNGTSFVLAQSIATNAADWESFVINGETYLVAANYYNGTTYNLNSNIYKWNGSSFVLAQSIATNGARDWESFVINGETYLAVVNHTGSNSSIYKWNGSSFALSQSLVASAPTSLRSVVINGATYLAQTDYANGIKSNIYKWTGSSFGLLQSIDAKGAQRAEFFDVNGETYLGIANYYDPSSAGNPHIVNSNFYKWNGESFVSSQSIQTVGATDLEGFKINGETYLAVASYWNQVSHNNNSPIYKLSLANAP